MKLKDRAINAFKAFTVTGETAAIFAGGGMGMELSSFSDNVTESELIKNYKKSLYTFIAVDKIATVTAEIEFDLFRVLNLEGDTEKLVSHPLLDLIYKPNEHQTKTEFLRIFAINMKLSAETFIRLIRADGVNITGMVNVRPDIVQVEFKDRGNGPEPIYKIYSGSEVIELDSTEMIHVKFPDPENPIRGASALRPAFTRMTAEQKAMELQKNVFENNGRPDGILSVKGLESQEAADKLKKKMKNTFSGKNKDERVAIISSEMNYQQVSLNSRDMDFMESLRFIRDDLFAALGVPKELVTLEDMGGLSNGSDAGMKKFLKFTINPLVQLFVEALNERMIEPFYNEPILLKSEEVVPEDRDAKVKEAVELKKAGVISTNTARELLGYEAEDGHDDIASSAPTPAVRIENAFKGRPALYKKVGSMIDLEMKIKEAVKVDYVTTPTAEYKNAYLKSVHNSADTNIDYMERETKRYFREQKARVQEAVENLEEKDMITADGIFDIQAEGEVAKRLALQTFPSMAVRSGNVGITPIKAFYEKVDDFTLDSELMKRIEERALFFAINVTGVTYDKILSIVAEGRANGDGRDKTARKIFQMFDDWKGTTKEKRTRAKRIAQTEGNLLTNIGIQRAFEKEERVAGKMWISAKDGKVREEHILNDSKVVDKGTAFPNGEEYPSQHSINCRCTIAPVIRQ